MIVVCKDNEEVEIDDIYINYFETLYNQVEMCDDTEKVVYPNLDAVYVKRVYHYLHHILTSNCVYYINQQELSKTLMTADFLVCNIVITYIVDNIRNIIKNADNDETIRQILGIKNVWNTKDYDMKKKDDEWCVKFNYCRSKFLKSSVIEYK